MSHPCAYFDLLGPTENCENCEFSVPVTVNGGEVSRFGTIAPEEGLLCKRCEQYTVATCEDFGENPKPFCPDGFLTERSVHLPGEVSPNGNSFCENGITCYKCVDPGLVRCSHFGLLELNASCENCEFSVPVTVNGGEVSRFGTIAPEEGLLCKRCEQYTVATCEDFGENPKPFCPDGFLTERSVHLPGEVSPNGNSFCENGITCYKCVDPGLVRCSHFGLLELNASCENCEFSVPVTVNGGEVSRFGTIAPEEGLLCKRCEQYTVATCEDFGHDSDSICPPGFLLSRIVHELGEISAVGTSVCDSPLFCFECNVVYPN